MSTTIAVVDDEEHLREAVVEYLQGKGFTVVEAGDAVSFRALVETTPVDIVVLDVAMPGEDGLSLARWLRRRGDIGIIFATASGQPIDRIVGLELGADDYLVKPYDLRELLARIRSLVRRLDAKPTTTSGAAPIVAKPGGRNVTFGPWTLELDGRRLVGADGRVADLTPLEYDLLEILATRPNRVLSRGQIAELGRGEGEGGEADRRIDIRITRLRKKIEPEPDRPRFIKTVRGEGYVFVRDGE
jgi:DNA-binding response OmpR family regulator